MVDIIKLRELIRESIDRMNKKPLQKMLSLIEDQENVLAESDDEDLLLNLSSEQEASLLRAIKDADEERLTPHNEVMKKYTRWISR